MGASNRCKNKTFLIEGIKIESGEAALPDGRRIVVGRPAGDGEVHLNEITEPVEVTVDTPEGRLTLRLDPAARSGVEGRRRFDPWQIAETDRALYIATAVRRMAIGAVESAEYTDTVLAAATRHGGSTVDQALIERAARLLDPANQQANERHAATLLAAVGAADDRARGLVAAMWEHEALLILVDGAQDTSLATEAQGRIARFDNILTDTTTGESDARRLVETLATLPAPPSNSKRKTKHQNARRTPALTEEERDRISHGSETMRGQVEWFTQRDSGTQLLALLADPKRRAWTAEILLLASLGYDVHLDADALKNATTREEAIAAVTDSESRTELKGETARALLDDHGAKNIPGKVATDPLYLRARAMARVLCGAAEHRVLEKIAAAIQGRTGGMTLTEAEKTVENLEKALAATLAVTETIRVEPHREPGLMLHPKDQERLHAISRGNWRPGRELLAESEQLLRAARAAVYAARNLRRDQEAAMRSAKTARNQKRVAEIENELLQEIPKELLDFVSQRDARRGGRGGGPKRTNHGPARGR
jgi:hypothetical protein